MSLKIRNRAAFTLLEILVAVMIVGILAAIAWPSYQRYIVEAKRSEAVRMLLAVHKAQEEYKAVWGSYLPGFDMSFSSPPSAETGPQRLNFQPPGGRLNYNIVTGAFGEDAAHESDRYAFSQFDGLQYLETGDGPSLNQFGYNVQDGQFKFIIGAESKSISSSYLDVLMAYNGQVYLACDALARQKDTGAAQLYANTFGDGMQLECEVSGGAGEGDPDGGDMGW